MTATHFGALPGTILGLDPGERRIGVAMAVPGGSMALPLTVLDATGDWASALAELVAEHRVAGIVVGLPISLSGSEGAAAARAREFAAGVGQRLGLPVHLVDERLSTVAAGRALAQAGARGRRAGRKSGAVDRSAAAVILQAWLDSQAGGAGTSTGPGRGCAPDSNEEPAS
ncbi:MAG TPA: Holliday junction resolvase RuvX [Acidimicrobiia bacterium]|nr:Holliday junction resolvase RuvX [Acidimicrobiia bacterium]